MRHVRADWRLAIETLGLIMKLNIGCGSVQPEGWVNADNDIAYITGDKTHTPWYADLTTHLPWADQTFDLIVADHVLSDLDYHQLPSALLELRRVLKDDGTLRVLVPDIVGAMDAYDRRDSDWFPQDENTVGLGARFCTFVTWFGTVKSVFTPMYLQQLLSDAGFHHFINEPPGGGCSEIDQIDRYPTCIIWEARP